MTDEQFLVRQVRRVFPPGADKRDAATLAHAIEAMVDITLSAWKTGVPLPDMEGHLQELDQHALSWERSVPLLVRHVVRAAYLRRRPELMNEIATVEAADRALSETAIGRPSDHPVSLHEEVR